MSSTQSLHSLAFRVMRLCRPTFHIETPLRFELSDLIVGEDLLDDPSAAPHLRRLLQSQSTTTDSSTDLTYSNRFLLRDDPSDAMGLPGMLVLPQAFGAIYLGETFCSYISINNSSSFEVRDIIIKAEIQTERQRILLLDTTKTPVETIRAGGRYDFIVEHDVKELGAHTLVCTAQYSDGDAERNTHTPFESSYKFITSNTKIQFPDSSTTMTDTPAPPGQPSTPSQTSVYIHPRREPFEHGLIPLPKLIFTDGSQTLTSLRDKLLQFPSTNNLQHRINSAVVSESLQISPEHARLVIDIIASVLHSDSDPLVSAKPDEVDAVGVNVYDLIIFLYIQSYKRLLPRGHKDSAAVADVWPSTSAFDGFLSALTPLQLVRSNSRRSMPSQADEEAHQLNYLQKHLGNIISLLSDSVEGEGEGEDSMVLSMEKFEHLGFLIYFGEKGFEKFPLSQNAPFFANSDPDMPAAPVPASQVHDWILQNISEALDRISERAAAKENGQTSPSDQDVLMTDASPSFKSSTSAKGPSFIEGISKQSYVKQASEINGSFVKVVNCHESVIYVLAPLKYATIYGCSDATIVLGPVGKAVRIEHCERVHIISAAKRICIANCRECIFFLGVNQPPLIVGDNHKLQVAPYNTFYPQLEEHMTQVGIEATPNRWGEPVALGLIDPHDSLSHPAGGSDCQAESATHLDPDQFTNFLIPNWLEGQASGPTKNNPFPLPDVYMTCQRRNENNLVEVKQILKEATLEDSRKKELSNALHVYFKDWLYASGNIRQLYCLQGE